MVKRQIKVKASGNGKELVPPQRHGDTEEVRESE